MPTKTERFISTVIALARIGVGLSFAVLIAAVLIQVVGRGFGSSPVWTEELTRFALLFLIAFGAGLSLRSGDMVNVDIVCEVLPGRWPWRLRLLSALATGALALFLLPHAWRFVSIGRMQSSPALGLTMSYVHLTVFLMLALLALFAALRVLGMLTGTEDGTPEKAEEI
ncbi:TRAP transporter small permease [Rhodovulum sp. BSW8]|uniref:TRAP transporter small permease protein n=1 Tax=Rhodovulum visakhapatnamense TaxID=364297 RepID=A0A4R8G6J3_9RHOB|nr:MULTISPECIES: TRAP transporter small permease [Rhodovulum]OLS45068.1 TRAP transporter small permease protein [Rhodovulum sulfidophilum]MBL3571217.1 TRAP transporter small permease [Rhodovulum visakhapatnamense]MBL3579100.1 TRAP transporter small permease [Rhodovulum visakhapatnamense]RBO52756.1 TRAP transporter small permease [Rhodovulum sp. BSW8]TDX32435.1 TRAP-type C4-dicarboxylate transport system permease small subunit [Rhodovulum visakhapatnamense]